MGIEDEVNVNSFLLNIGLCETTYFLIVYSFLLNHDRLKSRSKKYQSSNASSIHIYVSRNSVLGLFKINNLNPTASMI